VRAWTVVRFWTAVRLWAAVRLWTRTLALAVAFASVCGVARAAAPPAEDKSGASRRQEAAAAETAALQTSAVAESPTLARVRAAGVLRCGIDVEEAEYSTSGDHGNREAFDADLCRAVAAAVLGDNARLSVAHYPDDGAAMQGLGTGEVEMVPTLTDDFTHSVGTHLEFTRPVLWDSVGFLVPASSSVTRARELSGRKICFLAETTV